MIISEVEPYFFCVLFVGSVSTESIVYCTHYLFESTMFVDTEK